MRVRKFQYTSVYALLSLMLLTILGAGSSAQATVFTYDDSWGASGLQMTRQSADGLECTFSLTNWNTGELTLDGEALQTLHLPGVLLPNDAGAPDLPGVSRYVAVPFGASIEVNILESRTEKIPGVKLAPAPVIPKDTDEGPLVYARNEEIYSRNAYYPEQPVLVSPVTSIRGVNAALLGITPFQYNPVTEELVVYRDLRLEITFRGGNGQFGDSRLRNRWFDPILENALLNYSALPEIGSPPQSDSKSTDFEYVIICPDEPAFVAWADSLRNWRNEQGIRTGVVTTAELGGNTIANIQSYITNAYNTWTVPPVAILMLGDYDTGSGGIICPTWDYYCVTDNMYADMTGNDLPDIIMARMTAENETHLSTMIGKVLDNERNPPLTPGYYDNPIVAGGWQTERWFILCTEVQYGFLANELGKSPVREYAIYSGTPGSVWSTATNTATVTSYFGPSGLGYIPSTPSHLTDWGGSAARINADVNAGAFFLQHRDHGNVTVWGEPYYTNSDVAGMTNTEMPYVFSVNCMTGMFDSSTECLAEAFHRSSHGALGILAATESSYSFVNDTFVWGMYDYFWPDFDPGYGIPGDHDCKPAFANAAGKYFLEASSWPYNTSSKTVTYHLFHHHGDAFMTVHSELPQNLAVLHDPVLLGGVGFFSVNADAGSLIGISVGGDLLATATGTGTPQNISIPPQMPGTDVVITVTKQNCFRYRQEVPIIPPSGPFVVYDSHTIDDHVGNQDGLLDYGETAHLDITVENVGSETSTFPEAVISCSDPYITLLTDSAPYGDIPPGGTSAANNFEIQVDNGVPDNHDVLFHLQVTDSDSTYTSYFSTTVHAPDLVVDGYLFDDGDNFILDPGETGDFQVNLRNAGSSALDNLVFTLTTASPYLTINSGSATLPNLPPAASGSLVFNLTADAATPVGHMVDFPLDMTATNYAFNTNLALTVGLARETFESGYFASYPWNMGGDADWTSDTTDPFEGAYSARSGVVDNYESSVLTVPIDVVVGDSLTFWYKVSSESYSDALNFFVDGSLESTWDGISGWNRAAYYLTAGQHTLTWTYTKDGYGSSGSDCAWIDYITFPPLGGLLFADIDVTPTSYSYYLMPGDVVQTTLRIGNTGAGPLDFDIVSTPGGDWLDLSDWSGTVASTDSTVIDVTLDATNYCGGLYESNLLITSNDPDETVIAVLVEMHVKGTAPNIAVSESTFDFGPVFILGSAVDSFRVWNSGCDILTVSSIVCDHPDFTPNPVFFDLNAGEEQWVQLTFAPGSVGPLAANLSLTSNDPDQPLVFGYLQGEGLEAPDISVAPDSLYADLWTGEQEIQYVTLTNSGGNDLEWEVDVFGRDSARELRAAAAAAVAGVTRSGRLEGDEPDFPTFTPDELALFQARQTDYLATVYSQSKQRDLPLIGVGGNYGYDLLYILESNPTLSGEFAFEQVDYAN
ncbi:MAG: C25 family cysteine peptidase, partial [bacterium]